MPKWFNVLRKKPQPQPLAQMPAEYMPRRVREVDARMAPLQGVRSCYGYQREASVRQLGQHPAPGGVAALLERIGDWVPQVRQAAQQAIAAYMQPQWLPEWVQAAPELAAAHRVRRADISALLAQIDAFVRPHAATLRALSVAQERIAQRWLLGLQMDALAADPAALDVLARECTGKDVGMASMALQAIAPWPLPLQKAACERALASRFAGVRIQALRWLLAHTDEQQAYVPYALDPSRAIRDLICLGLPHARPAMLHMAATVLEENDPPHRRLAAAISLLHALQDERALPLARSLLAHDGALLRKLAYSLCIKAAQGPERDQLVWAALRDPSPKLAKLALAYIRDGAALPDRGFIAALLAQHPQRQDLACRLAEMKSTWVLLWLLLKNRTGHSQDNAHWWRNCTQRSDHLYVLPDAQLSAELRALWQEKSLLLEEHLQMQIQRLLQDAKVLAAQGGRALWPVIQTPAQSAR